MGEELHAATVAACQDIVAKHVINAEQSTVENLRDISAKMGALVEAPEAKESEDTSDAPDAAGETSETPAEGAEAGSDVDPVTGEEGQPAQE